MRGLLCALLLFSAGAHADITTGVPGNHTNLNHLWNDASANGVAFTQIVDVTVSSSSAETSVIGRGVGSRTLPANWCQPGRMIRNEIRGWFTTKTIAAGNVTARTKLGSTTIGTATVSNLPVGFAGGGYVGTETITFRSCGATGSVSTVGDLRFDLGAGLSGTVYLANSGSVTTIDTTQALMLDQTIQWSTADASNMVKNTQFVMETLNAR